MARSALCSKPSRQEEEEEKEEEEEEEMGPGYSKGKKVKKGPRKLFNSVEKVVMV